MADSMPPPAGAQSPLSPPNSRRLSKIRKPPPITPKRFTKFFTPRAASGQHVTTTSRSSRQLRELTSSSLNRRATRRRPRTIASTLGIENSGSDLPVTPSPTPNKRKVAPQSSSPLPYSSPIKRPRLNHHKVVQDAIPSSPPQMPTVLEEEELTDIDVDVFEDEDEEEERPAPEATFCQPIQRLKTTLNSRLTERAFGDFEALSRGSRRAVWNAPSYTTSNFYSVAEDVYQYRKPNLPFCTAACNTNPMVAVGTESGGVWMVDTSRKGAMSRDLLRFWPHHNAIIDMQFSEDDSRLAASGGDQSARVVDMQTQQTMAVFELHHSTIKQVRFQPGSLNVLATSSRDGLVALWDMRCSAESRLTTQATYNPLEHSSIHQQDHTAKFYSDPLHAISKAHLDRSIRTTMVQDEPYSANGVSVTSLSFISAERNHLLLTGSEASTSVKVWDLRSRYSRRSSARPIPVSSSQVPAWHLRTRPYGISSMVMSTDSSRLYVLSKDNTLYAYSTNHLILGNAPEMAPTSSSKPRHLTTDNPGAPALYGFRHPKLHVSTFFIKCALRKATATHPELIACGSGDSSPVLFSTSERDFPSEFDRASATADGCPIYQTGTVLKGGHRNEVSNLSWTSEGNLVSASDDYTVRCWREDQAEARELRRLAKRGKNEPRLFRAGWSEATEEYDDEDE